MLCVVYFDLPHDEMVIKLENSLSGDPINAYAVASQLARDKTDVRRRHDGFIPNVAVASSRLTGCRNPAL